MLDVVDRIQIAAGDALEAAKGWETLLGARPVGEDEVTCLGARRYTYRLGQSEVEFLEPNGSGAVHDAMQKRGRAHIFAAGASTPDPAALKAHFEQSGISHHEEHGQIHALMPNPAGNDFRFVLSKSSEGDSVGEIDFLYEVTLLGGDCRALEAELVRLFELDAEIFCPIKSDTFGYEGKLTLFDKDRLHRFEVITPWTSDTTMGRFLERQGDCFYMAFAQTASMPLIEERAREAGAPITVDRPDDRAPGQTPDQMWLHPAALGGVMLGLSRPTMAWKWSGHPERVEGVVV